MLNSLKILMMLYFTAFSTMVFAINTVSLQKETPDYLVDIKYPQGFHHAKVNSDIKDFIKKTQQSFLNELAEDVNTPSDAPGKTGLNIRFSVPYRTKNALSVRFNVSIYHRGAAHPANTIKVLNFVKGQPIQMSDLFISGADYLKPIAEFCSKNITAKNISDSKWIKEGTKADTLNYQVWFFNAEGIAIIFNTYQVAAYVYGEQTVSIPLSAISSLLQPVIAHTVWNH